MPELWDGLMFHIRSACLTFLMMTLLLLSLAIVQRYFYHQGTDALHLRTAGAVWASSLRTQGHVNSCSWGQFWLQLHRQNPEKKKKHFHQCWSYSVSLCSLIHVFVWNMSCLIKQTIKHNQSTLQRNQRAYWYEVEGEQQNRVVKSMQRSHNKIQFSERLLRCIF